MTPNKQGMKVLFLDMDGVVNSEKGHSTGLFKTDFPVDPYMAFLVGKIQMDTDCKVVLSSSWRHHAESVKKINERIVPIHDVTGHCCSGIRGVEIYNWIYKNVPYQEREEGGNFRYAILDDSSDMLLCQKDHFFRTSWKEGLTDEIAQKVINHLNS